MSVINILKSERKTHQERLKKVNQNITEVQADLDRLKLTKNSIQTNIQEIKTVLASLGDTSE